MVDVFFMPWSEVTKRAKLQDVSYTWSLTGPITPWQYVAEMPLCGNPKSGGTVAVYLHTVHICCCDQSAGGCGLVVDDSLELPQLTKRFATSGTYAQPALWYCDRNKQMDYHVECLIWHGQKGLLAAYLPDGTTPTMLVHVRAYRVLGLQPGWLEKWRES